MSERRRLPVLQEPRPPAEPPDDDEGDEARPPWHWVGFGTVAIFATWLPLAYAASAIASRAVAPWVGVASSPDELALRFAAMSGEDRMRVQAITVVPQILALAIAAFAGGLLVGRFGKVTGAREGALAGLVTSVIATALSWRGGGVSWTAIVIVVIAVGFAAWGGKAGKRMRKAQGTA